MPVGRVDYRERLRGPGTQDVLGMILRGIAMPGGRQAAPEDPVDPETGALVKEMFGGGKPKAEGPDFSDRFNTKLAPAEEKQFQSWLGQLSQAKGYDARQDLRDYDLRGAFKSGVTADERGHLTDTFKKPNHPTFSTESMYSGPDNPGGQWIQRPPTREGEGEAWDYRPSSTNLRYRSVGELRRYFQQVEPGSNLYVGPRERADDADQRARAAHRKIVGY